MTTTQQKIKEFLKTKASELVPWKASEIDITLVTEKEFEKLKNHLNLAKESRLNVIFTMEKENKDIKHLFIKN